MQKTENYKQTEVGLIPEEWEVKNIGDDIDLLTGFPFSSKSYSESGIRLLRGSNIKRGDIDWSEEITQYWPEINPKLKPYFLQEEDVVIAMDGSLVGRSFAQISKKDLPALLLQRVARVRSNKIYIGYLKEFICSSYFTLHCDSVKTSSAIPHISPADIRSFKIPIPPTQKEQTAIASALSDMDALIAQTEKLIEKKKAIKQGVMQELLTGKKRLKGFENSKGYKQTEVGVIPEDWECVKLKKVIKSMPDYGIGAAAVEFSLNLPVYLRITDISEDGDFLKSNISSVNSDQSRNYILGKGEVVVARTGSSVGKTYLYNPNDGELVFAGFLIRIRPDEQRLNSEFLFCLTQSKYYKDWIVTNSMRSGQPGINSVQISNLNIPLPPIEEQKSIASSIIDINNEIKVLDRRIEKLKLQKQGMMQALLTGKIRLV